MPKGASVRFGELNERNPKEPDRSRARAEVQIIGLSRSPGIGETRWSSGGPISERKNHLDRGAAVELGLRAAGIADDIELRLVPDGGNIKHRVKPVYGHHV